jgi:hypothetical protein
MSSLGYRNLPFNDVRNKGEAEKVLTPIQQFNGQYIYRFDSDKAFYTYELSELKALPKSLFYDAATSDGVYRGLFSYYVLGKNNTGNVKYEISEQTEGVQKISPQASRNPTAKQIIDVVTGSGGKPNYMNPNSPYRGQIYNVKDFIFCKYYGIIPNNRMLTLRRFAHPVLDSLRILANSERGDFQVSRSGADPKEKEVKYVKQSIQDLGKLQDAEASLNTTLPVAQLVTFFGGDTGNSLNDILGIDTGLNWTMETQDAVKNEQTGDPGLMNTPYGDLIKAAITSSTKDKINDQGIESMDKLVQTLLNPDKQLNKLERALLDEAVTAEGPLSKKIFVNVNTVNQMNRRAQGLNGGTNGFSLKFHYTLNSAAQANSKLLFLDLMTNILSVGADYAQFLTPEIRIEQTSLGLGFPGGPAKYAKSITDPMGYIREAIGNLLSKGEVDKRVAEENEVKKEMEAVVNELKQFGNDPSKGISEGSGLYKSLSVMISDLFLKKVYYSPLMLSGYPTGEWHLTIGNPLNPIAMMGNLVCKNVKISFNDHLGPDDFPTEMTATLTLEPGRQRHRGDWESMFNRGNGRLYLGQLVPSRESTQAFVNQKGIFPNDTDGKDIYAIVNENISDKTGTELRGGRTR